MVAGSGSPAYPAVRPPTPPPHGPRSPTGPRAQAAAIPFGSHSFSYVEGALKPSGSQKDNDAKVLAFYQK